MSKVDDSLVEQLCSIASVSKVVASNLLEACGNDLEMAVNMHMEGVVTEAEDKDSCNSYSDNVRAPIPQKQEILVDGPDQLSYTFRGRTRIARSVFDKFRDFQAETKRQEEELMGESSGSAFFSEETNYQRKKRKTLEDLFRPPLDIMFKGTFQAARDAGIGCKKWLLVNVQNSTEFSCQVLNRDVWSNAAVKLIIQEHFIFWQIYHDSDEGLRYMNFYPVNDWPYIAVIDPRTGECIITWKKMDAVSFCDVITEFLSSQSSMDDSNTSEAEPTEIPVSARTPPKKKIKKTSESIIEADEAAQIEAAIKASLEEDATSKTKGVVKDINNMKVTDDEDDDSDILETFDSDSEDVDYSLTEKKHIASLNFNSKVSIKEAIRARINESIQSKSAGSVNQSKSNVSNQSKSDVSNHSKSDVSNQSKSGDSDLTKNGVTNQSKNEVNQSNSDIYLTDDEDSDDNSSCQIYDDKEKWKNYLGKDTDSKSKLIIRLPDGSRDIVEMPSTSKLKALVLYVASKGFSNETYELVTNFPKKQLSTLDCDNSLKAVGLFPQETVFVQKR